MTPPTNTPWGTRRESREIIPGVWLIITASHGGFWLTPERRKQMRSDRAWYEEDVEVARPLLRFAPEFDKAHGYRIDRKPMRDGLRAFGRRPFLSEVGR